MKHRLLVGKVPTFVRMALVLAGLMHWLPIPAPRAAEPMVDTFKGAPETRWRFFTDTVMGGVSSGRVDFIEEGGKTHARMTGRVSTANNGGFIQIRLDLSSPPAETMTGLRLIVRGNGQRYFVHLRTSGTLLPWQYYQASFDASANWKDVRLPLSAFKPSGSLLRSEPSASRLTSIGIVAYGRDHDAEIEVREVGFY